MPVLQYPSNATRIRRFRNESGRTSLSRLSCCVEFVGGVSAEENRGDRRQTGTWRLAGGETDRTECKAGFRLQPEERFSKALRAIAGLANNKGGYLLFGVTDATFQADGLADDVFTKSDISLLNRILVGALDPFLT